jgi:hypothetical protein
LSTLLTICVSSLQAATRVRSDHGPLLNDKLAMPKAKKRRRAAVEQLPSVELSVDARGFESFPARSDTLGACVTVDNIGVDGEPVEIGSGACVSAEGLVLTAGHVAPTVGAVRRVSFPSGATFSAKCVRTAALYDLALLQVECGKATRSLPALQVAEHPAPVKAKLVCVGQPGVRAKQRLEANVGKCTAQSKDPLAKQLECGGMAHSCPVYAGSSGSPLLLAASGELVGVHTGFDLNRFEAQAVTLQAVRDFLAGSVELCHQGQAEQAGGRMGATARDATATRESGDDDSEESPLPLAERLARRRVPASSTRGA